LARSGSGGTKQHSRGGWAWSARLTGGEEGEDRDRHCGNGRCGAQRDWPALTPSRLPPPVLCIDLGHELLFSL
jgi:hypothetical protein